MNHERYMRRALQLARHGEGFAHPNPMVGAVIVAPDGRIIGEGWHRRWGGPHAEVNAVASVSEADRHLLKDSIIYVTLEPCSHYGKTPPCARLIIETGIPKVVIGSKDPFPKVAGGGIKMLEEAGVEVTVGVLEEECRRLNHRFMTAHTLGRPYIQLKWAQSADGRMAAGIPGRYRPVKLSTPLSAVWMHRERAAADAILVGTDTVINDDPQLTLRLWPGSDPLKVTWDTPRLPAKAHILNTRHILLDPDQSLEESMRYLYREHGVTSLMVEGGAETLRRFLRDGLWEEIRIETSMQNIGEGLRAPEIPSGARIGESRKCGKNRISIVKKT